MTNLIVEYALLAITAIAATAMLATTIQINDVQTDISELERNYSYTANAVSQYIDENKFNDKTLNYTDVMRVIMDTSDDDLYVVLKDSKGKTKAVWYNTASSKNTTSFTQEEIEPILTKDIYYNIKTIVNSNGILLGYQIKEIK